MSKLLICGDFAPTDSNSELIRKAEPKEIIGKEISDLMQSADLVAINLETAFVDDIICGKVKRGQLNLTDFRTADFFPKANISLCCLANNHSIDNGNVGLELIWKALDERKIAYVGAGRHKEDALSPYIFSSKNGRKVRILNIANFEFNDIAKNEYGVNVFDPFSTFDYIRMQASSGDYIIVIYHGGVEYYQYPSPELSKICRKMVDCGANLVTCQHSHCIGTYEKYKNSTIVYGQGNFLFDDSDKELEKEAILVELDVDSGEVALIPVKKDGALVRIADADEREQILFGIEKRRNEIKDDDFVTHQFKEFCSQERIGILSALAGNNLLYRMINKLSKRKFQELVFGRVYKMRIYNMISCPALLEVMRGVMKEYEEY